MAKYRLEVEVQETGWRSPGIIRLRKFLKTALRGYGIRCDKIEEGSIDDRDARAVHDDGKGN